MDGLGGMTGRGLTSLHFIPQSQTVTAEYYTTKILEKEVNPLFSRRSTTEGPVNESFSRTEAARPSYKIVRQLIQPKQPSSGARKTSQIFMKKMNGQQIHLTLTPLRTCGALLTKLHTEIRSL